jgi:hypothetical protein
MIALPFPNPLRSFERAVLEYLESPPITTGNTTAFSGADKMRHRVPDLKLVAARLVSDEIVGATIGRLPLVRSIVQGPNDRPGVQSI